MRYLALVALLSTSACSADSAIPVDPAFEVGFSRDGQFMPLMDGDNCPVINAIQGGYWIMPTMRLQGMGKAPTVGCTATLNDDGSVLGSSQGQRTFSPSADGEWQEGLYLLALAGSIDTGDDYAAIDGAAGTLSCHAMGSDVILQIEAEVTFDAASLDL